MKAIIINGEETEVRCDGLPQLTDVIELIKTMIDPDHMITSILLDGRDLQESDWTRSPSQFEGSVLEIQTGTPAEYVSSRLSSAAGVVRSCYSEFRDARKFFQAGQMQQGNARLVEAVNTLQAFFQWYATMLELVPQESRARYDIRGQAEEISEVCKKICQQQLYQSWWALGETLKGELEPRIDQLEDFCREFEQGRAA